MIDELKVAFGTNREDPQWADLPEWVRVGQAIPRKGAVRTGGDATSVMVRSPNDLKKGTKFRICFDSTPKNFEIRRVQAKKVGNTVLGF